MMRIITGKAKGIRLKTLDGDSTRPTSERVKEAVFSMLQGDMDNREVLDLFAGSGQMGLEAVSRGAAHATMIDNSPFAIKVISENAQKTKLDQYCTIKKDEALSFLRFSKSKKYDIIFLDPPYSANLYRPSLEAMLRYDVLKNTSIIVCESDTEDIFESDEMLSSSFDVIKHSRYGRIFITILSLR